MMHCLRSPLRIPLLLLLVLAPAAAAAQETGSDRLFLSFIEDATVVEKQWWEGQLEYAAGDEVDLLLLRGVVAFQPIERLEVGGRVGFGNSSVSEELAVEDGTGATDLDAWGKYLFSDSAAATQFAAGVVLTVPTGDDAVGLGTDSFGTKAFGTVRHAIDRATLSGHVGVRLNGDGRVFGTDIDGKTSTSLGFGYIAPLSDEMTFVGEASYESKRFDGGESDARVLGGINWRPFNRGIARGAVAVGLSDGAPDFQVLIGYAAQF